MSKQLEADSTYEHGVEAGFTRKQIIQEIAIEVGVSTGYASTLYNNAKKATQPARHSAERNAQTAPVAPMNLHSKITTFTKPTLRMLRDEMNTALKAVMDKHGISHKIGNMSFNGGEFSTSLTVSAGSQTEVIKNTFDMHCSDYGLKPSDLNREFTSNGKSFTITGIKPNRRKYPISGVGAQGGKYKFTAEQVVRNLV